MSDKITAFNQFKLDLYFVDGDTRTITLNNPKSTLSSSEISELNSFMQANNVVIGDRTGATFGKITKGRRVTGTKTSLDISIT